MNLDLRHLGEKVINTKLPFVRELCLKYQNIDPVTELVPVRPVIHYMMGGVHTDINGATPLPGLYAAGDLACVPHNYMIGAFVFGDLAGTHAASGSAEGAAPQQLPEDQLREAHELIYGPLRHPDGPPQPQVEYKLRRFVNELLGPLLQYAQSRDTPLLETLEALSAARWIRRAAARQLGIHINSMTYRVERIQALTGLQLDDPETRVAISIALRARAMLGM